MLKRIEKHHRINAITLKKITSLNSPILEPRGSKEHKFVFDASFDIFTKLSYENSSTRSSNSLPTLSTHTHTHSWGQTSKPERRWAQSCNAETMEEFSQRVCLAADGRREKKTNGDSRHGVANPALLFIMARRGKSGKYTGARFAVSRPNIWSERDLRGEERVSEDVVIVRRFAIERGLDSEGRDCRRVGEDENHGEASTVSWWRR